MKPELVLMCVPHQLSTCTTDDAWCPSPLHSNKKKNFIEIGHWDPNQIYCFGVIGASGVIKTYFVHFEDNNSYNIIPTSAYQLHLVYYESPENSLNDAVKVVDVQLGNFEYIPNRTDEIVFFQLNSTRILFAKLPTNSSPSKFNAHSNKVFCIGTHSSKILCISVRKDGLLMLSASLDGSIRGWRLSDGSMLFETIMPMSQPSNYCIDPFKEKCYICGEALENDIAYLSMLSFISWSPVFAMGCLDGLLQLWKISCENLQSDCKSVSLELVFEETLLSADNAYITAFAIHSLGLSYGDVEQGAGEVSIC